MKTKMSESSTKTWLAMAVRCLLIAARRPRQSSKRKVGRNDPCICQSGKKFKRCCWNKVQDARDRNPNL